jgi:uridine kinase
MSFTLEETTRPVAYDLDSKEIIFYDEEGTKYTKSEGEYEIMPASGQIGGEESENVYISGKSGSGKSTVARHYAMNYRRMFPKNKIYLITHSDETNIPDKNKCFYKKTQDNTTTYAKLLDIIRVPINEHTFGKTSKIDVTKDYRNCLMIFDDFLYIENEEHKKKVIKMIIQVMTEGRKIGVYSVITAHLPYEKINTDLYQTMHTETHKFVFCKGSNVGQLRYVFNKYFVLRPKTITKILRFDPNSRWICLNKYPAYVLSHNKLELLNDE